MFTSASFAPWTNPPPTDENKDGKKELEGVVEESEFLLSALQKSETKMTAQ